MKKKLIKFISFAVILGLVVIFSTSQVLAGNLSTLKDTLNRLVQNQTSGITHKIIFTAETATSGGSGNNEVIIVAPDADDNTWCAVDGADLTVAGCTDESSTSLPGTTLTGTCAKGTGAETYDTITIGGVDDLSATKYCVDISEDTTAQLGTPAAGEHVMTVKTNDGTDDIDAGEMAIQILTSDQVAVSGKIGTTLTFTITNPTIGFGTWTGTEKRWANSDSSGATSEPATADLTTLGASTNATSGLTITIKSTGSGSNAGLYSSATSTLIPAAAPNSITEGTAGYAAYGANDSTDLTIEPEFAVSETTATLLITAQSFVTATTPVSSGSTVDLALIAAVASATPAGTYSDTLTLNCTGNF